MIKKGKTDRYKNKTSFSMIPLVHIPQAIGTQQHIPGRREYYSTLAML